jgi:hypothetical protein
MPSTGNRLSLRMPLVLFLRNHELVFPKFSTNPWKLYFPCDQLCSIHISLGLVTLTTSLDSHLQRHPVDIVHHVQVDDICALEQAV